MTFRFLSSGERKKLATRLKEQFGLSSIPSILIQAGKEKIRAFSGSLDREELIGLGALARVEFVGLYFAREDFGLRLSFDATQLIGPQLTEHCFSLNKEQFELWMRGEPLVVSLDKGVYAVKYGDDFLGCGFSTGEKLLNYVPRERQLKK